MKIIDSNLEIVNGKIKLHNFNMSGKKQYLKSYFGISYNEVPFWDFGNKNEQIKFSVLDDDLINMYIEDLVLDLKNMFDIEITNYYYGVDHSNNEILIEMVLADGNRFSFRKGI